MTQPFDRIMASLDPPMTVVTTSHAGERSGCLVGFHAQGSIGVKQYAVWLSKANHTYRVGVLADRFAVHWLSEGDEDLAEHFGSLTGDDVDKFAGVACTDGGDGLPLLDRVPNRMVALRHAELDHGGDHVCVVLDPLEVLTGGPFEPLRFSAVRHLHAGHPPDEY